MTSYQKIYSLSKIETPRLIIRPVTIGDEVSINNAIHNTLDLLQEWQPWAQDPSLEATRTFINNGVAAWASKNIIDFPMTVIHKIDQKIIGASGYNDRSDPIEGLFEIGYWIDKDYQGHGYVTEYVNALTRFAFTELHAKKVVISALIENQKSIAVAKRLNFNKECVKDRDPQDTVIGKIPKDILYTCDDINRLPLLETSCAYKKDN